MSSFRSSYIEGNRIYWEIPDCLPVGNEKVIIDFELLNKSWQYVAYYNVSGRLSVIIDPITPCTCFSFEVRGGIIGDSKKELIVENAMDGVKKKSNFLLVGLVHRSKIDLYKTSNKVLFMFIDMKKINHKGTEIIISENSRKRKLEKDYEDLLLSATDSDLTIEVKNKQFKCHRCILRVRSSVFSAMLEHNMKEKSSDVIRIIDAEPTVFQEFLLYLYTGNSNHLNWKNVCDLYKLCDKYNVEDLKSLCVEQAKKDISTENFNELFLLSQQCNDSELTERTVQFFLKNSDNIIDNENWLTYLSKYPVEFNVLIKALSEKILFFQIPSRQVKLK